MIWLFELIDFTYLRILTVTIGSIPIVTSSHIIGAISLNSILVTSWWEFIVAVVSFDRGRPHLLAVLLFYSVSWAFFSHNVLVVGAKEHGVLMLHLRRRLRLLQRSIIDLNCFEVPLRSLRSPLLWFRFSHVLMLLILLIPTILFLNLW